MVLGDAARVAGDVTFRASDGVRVSDAATVGGALVQARVVATWARGGDPAGRAGCRSSASGGRGGRVLGLPGDRSPVGAGGPGAPVAQRPGRPRGAGAAPDCWPLPLFLTLVGLPVAVLILLFWVLGLFLGPIPAVAAAGGAPARRPGRLLAGFVVGALLWRAGCGRSRWWPLSSTWCRSWSAWGVHHRRLGGAAGERSPGGGVRLRSPGPGPGAAAATSCHDVVAKQITPSRLPRGSRPMTPTPVARVDSP